MPYQRLRLHWDGFSPPTPVLIPYFHLTATIFLSLLVIQSNATCADCCIHGICSAGYKFGPAQCCGRMRATNEANSSIVFVCCPLPASVCVKRAGRLGCAFHRRQPGAGRQDEIIMIVGIGVAIAIGLCILIKWCCQKCYESRSRNQEASLPEVEDREPAVPPVPIRQPSPWVSPPRQEDRRVSTSSTGRPSAPLIPQQQQELPPPPPYTGPPPPYTAPTTTYPNYYQPDVYPGR